MSPSEMPAKCSRDAGPPSRGGSTASVAKTDCSPVLCGGHKHPILLLSPRAAGAVSTKPLSETIFSFWSSTVVCVPGRHLGLNSG